MRVIGFIKKLGGQIFFQKQKRTLFIRVQSDIDDMYFMSLNFTSVYAFHKSGSLTCGNCGHFKFRLRNTLEQWCRTGNRAAKIYAFHFIRV